MENNWTPVSFSDAVNLNPTVKLTKGEEYPFVDMKSVDPAWREVSFSELRAFKSGGAKFLPKDTLMARITPCLENGKIVRYLPTGMKGEAFGSTEFIVIRGKDGVTDNDFAYYLTMWPEFREFAISQMTGSSGRQRVPVDSLAGFSFNLPPLTEQKAIAHILGSLDDKIELNRRMNETLEAIAQALFKSWFVDFDPVIDNALSAGNDIPEELSAKAEVRRMKAEENNSSFIPHNSSFHHLFPSEFEHTEEMGWIPKGWKVETFGYFLADTIGGDWGKEKPDEKHTERVLIIRGTDMPDLRSGSMGSVPIRWVEKKKLTKRKLEDGDIVIEVSGGSPKQPTGRSLYMTQNIIDRLGGVSEPASFCRLFRPKSQEYGLIASQHLTYIYSQGKMWEYQNQSTGISNFQTTSFLERERIVMPDVNEILIFFLDVVRPLIDKSSDNQSIGLSNLRDTLLPQLLSGEMRIPEAEKLVEEIGIMRDEL